MAVAAIHAIYVVGGQDGGRSARIADDILEVTDQVLYGGLAPEALPCGGPAP
jgi:hypothetical protein